MNFESVVMPRTIEEAYELLKKEGHVAVGGGAWLHQQQKKIHTAVDLSYLGIDQISQTEESVYIGAMTNLRQIEKSEVLLGFMNGILPQAVSQIMGVTVRNLATIGGTIMGRLGFSDLITCLLALGASLHFHERGEISIEDFLQDKGLGKDLLIKIQIRKEPGYATFQTLKKTSLDFPIMNISVMRIGDHYRIAVGARPGIALLAYRTMKYLNGNKNPDPSIIHEATEILLGEIPFGDNLRGTKTYRQGLAKTLFLRGLREVVANEN